MEEADIEYKDIVYIFKKQEEVWFHELGDKSKRFSINESIAGNKKKFLKEGMEIQAMIFKKEIIDIKIPIKVDLKVEIAPHAIKGNTAQGATKTVTLETGAEITTPLFINEGDIIRVNTEKDEYTERVEKK